MAPGRRGWRRDSITPSWRSAELSNSLVPPFWPSRPNHQRFAPWWGPTVVHPGNERRSNSWLSKSGTFCRSQRISQTAILCPPGWGQGAWGGRGQQVTVDLKSKRHPVLRKFSTSYSCLSSQPPQPFYRLKETIVQSATEATSSWGEWEKAIWWGQRMEVPEQSKGSACPSGLLRNTRLRRPEEVRAY